MNRNDSPTLDQHRQLPQRSSKIIDDASTLIHIASEIIHPFPLRQVNTITLIIAILVNARLLINRSHQDIRPVHKLILRTLAQSESILLLQEHRTYHRLTIHSLTRYSISIRQQYRLQFQIVAVNLSSPLALSLRILRRRAPAVHIQLHRSIRLPLEVAHIHRHIHATKDSIHITRHIRLASQTRADIRRDMEADILPLAASLVASPYTSITLRTSPAIESDDKRTRIIAIIRHHLSHVSHTIQAKRITGTHPSHISLEHTHPSVMNLLNYITLQERLHTLLRVQVRLSPQSNLHTTGAGIITKLLQVLDIAVQAPRPTIASTIPIIRQEPPQGEVIV